MGDKKVPFRSILLALPTTSQSVKSATTLTIAKVVKQLLVAGIDVDLHNIDSAEIVTARDMFANMVLHSAKWDGLLFIDSDMAFDARVVSRLIERDEDVVAAACPRRSLNFDRLLAGAQAHGNFRKAVAQGSDFTVKLDWEGKRLTPARSNGGFCSAVAVGMACALISRNALLQMVEQGVVTPRADLQSPAGPCWSFFGIVEAMGQRFGEDYSFCYRWTSLMKRQLSVCMDEDISHIGHFDYTARYSDSLDL
jgi:hypothetical protein